MWCCCACSDSSATTRAPSRSGSAPRTRSPDSQKTSLVSIGYGSGLERVASLGVLGPTRMDYPTTMASVRAVARYVSEILDENHTG